MNINDDRVSLKRKEIQEKIYLITAKIDNELIIRGSWSNGDFHLNFDNYFSYSDLDLYMARKITDKSILEKKIQNIIKAEIDLKIPVSIHTKNSLGNLTLSNAHDLALLEYSYQIRKKNSLNQINYLQSKFLLYLSRENVRETYLDIRDRIKDQYIDTCYLNKIGESIILTEDYRRYIINKYIKNELVRKKSLKLIVPINPKKEVIDIIYNQLMVNTNLDDFLKNRIKEKYNSINRVL